MLKGGEGEGEKDGRWGLQATLDAGHHHPSGMLRLRCHSVDCRLSSARFGHGQKHNLQFRMLDRTLALCPPLSPSLTLSLPFCGSWAAWHIVIVGRRRLVLAHLITKGELHLALAESRCAAACAQTTISSWLLHATCHLPHVARHLLPACCALPTTNDFGYGTQTTQLTLHVSTVSAFTRAQCVLPPFVAICFSRFFCLAISTFDPQFEVFLAWICSSLQHDYR